MSRASKVVTLVLLGSSLAWIGWYVYRHWHDDFGGTGTHGYHPVHHSGFYGWFGGGGYGPSRGGFTPASRGVTARGGFGATGVGAGE
jgi:hypothetical protein